MRKLLPFVLAFVLLVCFVACKDDETPSVAPPATDSSQNSVPDSVSVSEPANENVPQTYLLTTTPDMSVPSVATTPFDVSNETVSTNVSSQVVNTDFNLTVSSVTAPPVNSSALPSVSAVTTSSTSASAQSASSETTTTKKEETTSAATKAVNIIDSGVGVDGSGKRVVYSIDPSCGNFKSNTTVITVTVDGEEYDNIPCKISASNLDASGCQQVFIDLSGIENLESGSTVSFSVPSGFLTSKDGKSYNRSFGNTIIV